MADAAQLEATELDELAERFFNQEAEPQAWEVALDDWQPRPLEPVERRAMFATFAMLAIGGCAALGLALFADAVMISPAPLGAAGRALPVLTEAEPRLGEQGLHALAEARAHAEPASVRLTAVPADRAPSPAAEPRTPAAEPRLARSERPVRARPASARRSAPPEQRSPAAGYAAQARRALKFGDAQQARELASRAIRVDPGHAPGYIALAGALDALGDRAGVKSAFQSCAKHAGDRLAAACKSLAR